MRNEDRYLLMSFSAVIERVEYDEEYMTVHTSEGTWSTKTRQYNVREMALAAIGHEMQVYVSRDKKTGVEYYSSCHAW